MPEVSNADDLLSVWRKAALIYAVDERFRQYASKGVYKGALYSARGQEVVAAAMGACLDREDYLVTTYRGMHDQIAKGADLPGLVAEMFGKRSGTCRGKGGPMHITDPSCGVLVTTGIVGSGIPIGVGLAWSAKFKGSGQVCATSFGDGATNIGAFHEGLNLAAIWNLPVVFVCQNNEYAEFTPRHETQLVEIWQRAAAYGIQGVRVDGDDAESMYSAMREAVKKARSGDGPTLLDCQTFRFMGHFFGDPQRYMDRGELERRMKADPVPRLRQRLSQLGHAEETLAGIEAEIASEVDRAFELAVNADDPATDELLEDVYLGVAP
jgi:pyruvate dehydrogenase E1 component alpha subunit